MAARDYGQYSGITRAMELVGERWALLIVRDLLVGPRRYGELAAGLHRIPSNILAARLKELQAAGIIRRAPRSRVILYELTPYGRELEPVVLALGAWGIKAMGEPRDEQVVTADSMTMDLRSAFRPQVALELPPTAYGARLAGAELLIRVRGSTLEVTSGVGRVGRLGPVDLTFPSDSASPEGSTFPADPAFPTDSAFPTGAAVRTDLAFSTETGAGIRQLITGELAPDRAISAGVVEVLHGRSELLDRFATTFHIAA